MKAKRLAISGIVTGLLVWGLSELFSWISLGLFGLDDVLSRRLAPAFAGATLGISVCLIRMQFQAMRQKMIEEGKLEQPETK